ncbi:Conserved phage C-terminus [Popillia japonica]|uniref:Conserved phage C-terminus n=1 Tax=Popillia japonica TaxID=7064 RepID=A0AAW1HVW7_POPJA
MPLSTQSLYFHLSMRGDDEGFINNPRKIQKMIGASEDDLKLLIVKGFIIPFESGVVVIKHWKIHNYIRGDRKKATTYSDEKKLLEEKENGAYTLKTDGLREIKNPCQSLGGHMSVTCPADVSIGKVRLGKVSIGKDSNIVEQSPTTYPYKEVIDYLNQAAGKQFKSSTEATKKYIRARFNEGNTLDDFKRVIDTKTAEWNAEPEKGQKDMRQYLRPKTLFGTNFESYLNQEPQKGGSNGQPTANNTEIETDDSLYGKWMRGEIDTGEFEGFGDL